MIFENNVTLVFMLCEFKVKGKEQCYRYLGKRVIDINIGSPSKPTPVSRSDVGDAEKASSVAHFKTPDNLL